MTQAKQAAAILGDTVMATAAFRRQHPADGGKQPREDDPGKNLAAQLGASPRSDGYPLPENGGNVLLPYSTAEAVLCACRPPETPKSRAPP